MRPVVQYEIYFLKEGRWTLHGRYPAAERQDAIKEAMLSEGSTGLPTKVIRDTYFPDTNAAETVTIYTSPKLKAMSARGTPPPLIKPPRTPVAQASAPAGGTVRRQTSKVVGQLVADVITRAVLAACLSTLATAIVTSMVSWLLSRMTAAGLPFSSQMTTMPLSFVSIGMFALGFLAFYRTGARFKQVIRNLWASTSVESVANTTIEMARAIRFSPKDIKPKNPSRVAAETERAMQEVKRQRGDPDAKPEAAPAAAATAFAATQTQQAASATSASASPQPVPAPETTSEPRPLDLITAAQQKDPQSQAGSQAPARTMQLEQILLNRFVAERVLPLVKEHAKDPISRRGLAFLMSGAVSHLVVVSKLDQTAQDALLAHGLAQCKVPSTAIEAFRHMRTDSQSDAGWQLQDAGRGAMAAFLEGGTDTWSLLEAWRNWRVPVRLVQPAPSIAETVPPYDTFLVTELREATDPAVMEFHNRQVRAALAESGGEEIKHTGKGILARYRDCNAAVSVAISIAEVDSVDFGEHAGWIAVALVPGFSAADDPMLSPRVSQMAETYLTDLRGTEIACDRAVLAAANRGLPPGYFAHDGGADRLVLRRQPAPAAALGVSLA